MTTTGADPTTTPPASAATPSTAIAKPPAAPAEPKIPPEPKNAQAIRSLEADERAAELPSAPSTTMNAFASGYAFETAQRMANALASSSVVPKAYIGNPANCLIAMEVANRVRMSVIAVMQNLDIVHGNPSWRSKFLIAMANSSRKFSRLKWSWFGTEGKDDWGCRAFASDLADGEKLVGPLVSIAIAKGEGWYDRTGTKWKTIPELMLMYRAAGWWARVYDPEDSMGFSTVEESEDVHGVEFDERIASNPRMKDVPGAAAANEGRRMSLRPTPPEVPIQDAEVTDPAETTEATATQVETAKATAAAAGEQLATDRGEPHSTTIVSSGTEAAIVDARERPGTGAREPGSDDDDDDKGDDPLKDKRGKAGK